MGRGSETTSLVGANLHDANLDGSLRATHS